MRAKATQDGALAWLVCSMSFLNATIIGGFVFATGMFYLMFKNSLNATDSEVALITSINVGVMHTICPFVGILCERFDCRWVALTFGVISTAGLAFSAFSTEVFHLYICYGVILGAGQGVINIISITMINLYFHKYKRTACSIALAGYGVGSFIVPSVINALEKVYGWRGALLLMAGMNAHILVTCSFYRPVEMVSNEKQPNQAQNSVTLKEGEKTFDSRMQLKLPKADDEKPRERSGIKRKAFEMFYLFKVLPFVCMSFCNMIVVFAISIILTHFGNYLLTLEFTEADVVNLYITLGVCATVARPLAGVVAEVTHANMATFIMLTIALNGMLTICVPFMKLLWMMYVYTVLYQLLAGPYLGLGAVVIMEHVPRSQVATAYGIYSFFSVPGFVLGAPTGAWIYEHTQLYALTFYLAGGLMIIAGLAMAPAAYYIHKKRVLSS